MKSKKTRFKKVMFGTASKATTRRKKGGKIKGFFANPYVEAAATGLLGGASYVIARNLAEKIFDKKTRVDVEEKVDCETDGKVTVGHGVKKTVQLFAYTFTNYDGKDMYVCPKFRAPLGDDDLRRFRDLAKEGDEAALIEALKQHDQLYSLYVG